MLADWAEVKLSSLDSSESDSSISRAAGAIFAPCWNWNSQYDWSEALTKLFIEDLISIHGWLLIRSHSSKHGFQTSCCHVLIWSLGGQWSQLRSRPFLNGSFIFDLATLGHYALIAALWGPCGLCWHWMQCEALRASSFVLVLSNSCGTEQLPAVRKTNLVKTTCSTRWPSIAAGNVRSVYQLSCCDWITRAITYIAVSTLSQSA